MLFVNDICSRQTCIDVACAASAEAVAGIGASEGIESCDAGDTVSEAIGVHALIKIADVGAADQGEGNTGPSGAYKFNGCQLLTGRGPIRIHESVRICGTDDGDGHGDGCAASGITEAIIKIAGSIGAGSAIARR